MTTAPHVLHLCSDFARQPLYNELVTHLEALGLRQFVYVPIRTREEDGVNRNEALNNVRYRFAYILRPRHRLLFRTKIRRAFADLVAHARISDFDVVHAHFLYSDGGLALKLKREFGVPYIVAVRNTDVNAFMRLRPDLRWICHDIIEGASRIVFVTPAYTEIVRRYVPARARSSFDRKVCIVPNGLADFWHRNAGVPPRNADGTLKLLYVGDFSRNKNIRNTLRAAALLRQRRPVTLTLVGGGGDGEREIESLLAGGDYPFVTRVPRITDRERLLAIYREHDIFVMPSFRETFGLVYLEALSQGLPVIYSRGQGVDGYFARGLVGEAVEPSDPADISIKIESLAQRLEQMRAACVEQVRRFSWPEISRTYVGLYCEAGSLAA